jgi:hypothetical protein
MYEFNCFFIILLGRQFALEHNFLFYETSAKTAHNIQVAFLKTTRIIYQKITSGEIDVNNTRQGVKFYLNGSSSTHTIASKPLCIFRCYTLKNLFFNFFIEDSQKDATDVSVFSASCCSTL